MFSMHSIRSFIISTRQGNDFRDETNMSMKLVSAEKYQIFEDLVEFEFDFEFD